MSRKKDVSVSLVNKGRFAKLGFSISHEMRLWNILFLFTINVNVVILVGSKKTLENGIQAWMGCKNIDGKSFK